MMLWLVIGLIALGSLLALAWPLFTAPKEHLSPDETDYLAAQLDDVDRERAIGVLSESEAETARLEAKRRLLAAGRPRSEAGERRGGGAIVRRAALIGVAAIPLAATALYLGIGAPDRTSTSARAAAAQASEERPVADLIAGLEDRLAANPDDVEGWMTLGESHAAFGRYDEAVDAFARASAIDPGSAFIHAAFAEALILAAGGAVTEEADAALAQALTLDPKEPRARFYQAQGLYQAGDKEGALGVMTALVNEAPDDAPWLAIAHNQLVSIAMETGKPLRDAGLSEAAEARLKQQMEREVAVAEAAPARSSPGDAAALEAKVASGDAHYTEWLQLAERHAAAGDAAKAADVLVRARERYAAAPFVLQEIARTEARLESDASAPPRPGPTAEQVEAAQSMTPQDQQAMIEGMVSGLAARLEAEPDDPDGWMMLGRSYGVLGDLGKSADAFSHAAALKPDDIAVQLSYAQALLAEAEAANAPIDRETEKVLESVLERDADQTFALYYLGLAAQQRQDNTAAKRHWERLAALLPADSEDAKRIGELLQSLDQPPRP